MVYLHQRHVAGCIAFSADGRGGGRSPSSISEAQTLGLRHINRAED